MNDYPFEALSRGTRNSKNRVARCPSCSTRINLRDDAEVWDLVTCPECNSLLEIVDLRPPTLDYTSDSPEDIDWDDEDWEDRDQH